MRRRTVLLTLVLPILWVGLSTLSFSRFPGDEYGTWILVSLPGVWVGFIDDSGDIRELLPRVLVTGAVVCAILGFGVDALLSRQTRRDGVDGR